MQILVASVKEEEYVVIDPIEEEFDSQIEISPFKLKPTKPGCFTVKKFVTCPRHSCFFT